MMTRMRPQPASPNSLRIEMNVNQIINMVMRIFVRKGVNWGINKGATMVAKRSPAKPGGVDQSTQARAIAKRARQAARITRRMGR